jgi:8-oxo-dGTP diphosphatase
MGIGGQQVTIVVDVANVMGSRPDGWWRDRAGAAVRLHAEIVRLARTGGAIVLPSPAPDEPGPASSAPASSARAGSARAGSAQDGSAQDGSGPGEPSPGEPRLAPGWVMVLEGAARAAAARVTAAEPDADADRTGPVQPGEVRVLQARGSGDDTIVAVARELPGRRVVVTADRGLRARCVAVGAEILGPGWLLGLLRG